MVPPPLRAAMLAAATRSRCPHLGVEVETPGEVTAATARLDAQGLPVTTEEDTACCYAVQDRAWVAGPGSEPWEVYVVTADSPVMGEGTVSAACCTPAAGHACC